MFLHIGVISKDLLPGATAHVVAKLGFIPVLSQDIDICAQVPGGCPLAKAPNGAEQQLAISQYIPGIAPAGKLNLEIKITNGDKESIGCLKGAIQIVKP